MRGDGKKPRAPPCTHDQVISTLWFVVAFICIFALWVRYQQLLLSEGLRGTALASVSSIAVVAEDDDGRIAAHAADPATPAFVDNGLMFKSVDAPVDPRSPGQSLRATEEVGDVPTSGPGSLPRDIIGLAATPSVATATLAPQGPIRALPPTAAPSAFTTRLPAATPVRALAASVHPPSALPLSAPLVMQTAVHLVGFTSPAAAFPSRVTSPQPLQTPVLTTKASSTRAKPPPPAAGSIQPAALARAPPSPSSSGGSSGGSSGSPSLLFHDDAPTDDATDAVARRRNGGGAAAAPALPLVPSALPVPPAASASAPFSLADMPCPTVFVYHKLPLFEGDEVPDHITEERAFGRVLRLGPPGLYATPQWEVEEIFLSRLYRSEHCPVARDPKSADLFLIPAMSAPKDGPAWATVCRQTMMEGPAAAKALRYLNAETAPRHLVFIPKGHYLVSNGSGCAWLRGEAPPFDRIQRFSYSHTFGGQPFARRLLPDSELPWTAADGVLGRPPAPPGLSRVSPLDGRVVSVPYPTTVHWSNLVPPGQFWASTAPRPLLISLFCGFHGVQEALRRRLFADCNKLGPPLCVATRHYDHVNATAVKRSSVFCLEPEGDSPFRKSIYDSMLSGCIPVLFSLNSDAVSPWHWGPFRADSRVLMSPDDYMNNVTSLETLRNIPAERVAHMQATIRAHAHKLHYAFEDYPSGDDGVEVLLKKALLRAQGVSLADLEKYS